VGEKNLQKNFKYGARKEVSLFMEFAWGLCLVYNSLLLFDCG